MKTDFKKWPLIEHIFEPRPRVAVIRMSGLITDSAGPRRNTISHDKYYKLIEKAFSLPNLKAVALVINSPGGAPAQCSLITDQIRDAANEDNVPVYAFIEDVAASGGYWLACAGDKIFAQESSIVGSIGVLYSGFGLKDFIERYGIKRRLYTSGEDKAFMDPFVDEKDSEVKRLKNIQDDIHEQFRDWVKSRRGDRLNGPDKELLEGDFWSGRQAYDKGLIDGIGQWRSILRDEYGPDAKFVTLAPEKKLLPFLPLGSRATFAGQMPELLNALEEYAARERYGL